LINTSIESAYNEAYTKDGYAINDFEAKTVIDMPNGSCSSCSSAENSPKMIFARIRPGCIDYSGTDVVLKDSRRPQGFPDCLDALGARKGLKHEAPEQRPGAVKNCRAISLDYCLVLHDYPGPSLWNSVVGHKFSLLYMFSVGWRPHMRVQNATGKNLL
jgi:hypothetical protein